MSAHAWPLPLPALRDLDAEARGWRDASASLAAVFGARLVNRVDVWGAYVAPEARADFGATWTAPPIDKRGAWLLSPAVIQRHCEGIAERDVIGLHAIAQDGTCRFAGIDVDAHADMTADALAARRDAVEHVVEMLTERGAAPLVEDSNGAGGYHVWNYFDHAVPSVALFAWLSHIARAVTTLTGVPLETYPKQATLDDQRRFGNWLRLPGRHHTRAHWSRVARPGCAWASGAHAAFVMRYQWPATPASVVPDATSWPANTDVPCAADRVSYATPDGSRDLPRDRAAVIRRYLDKLPNSGPGARSDRLFSLARFLRHGMKCSDAEALPILEHWNASNTPPLPVEKLRDTWTNAGKYASEPFTLRVGLADVA